MAILIADADGFHVKLTTFILHETGYQVVHATDVSSALNILHSQEIDLVLMEVLLPDTSEFELCRRIRRLSDVPIIFLTKQTIVQDCVQGLQLGGDDYLRKPCDPQELLARIEAVLRRSVPIRQQQATRLSQGSMSLDLVEQQVWLTDEHVVLLTPTEFRLLAYLMANPGRVVTIEQILGQVWDSYTTVSNNLVATYVRRLRGKIEPDPTQPEIIRTVSQLGYTFVAPTRTLAV
ncbi:MAG: response regulator transcription factor [Chloroflexi bacterium AL-W]|nr:response regulator transcription factor [Chloroflexi bacterium AL-N1]NOK66414.1 response regulator transcription factor [Chloroflexi bacterium AL-N10]NOK71802.1 response regulator transcription factor [Chloroflexi bacterium AL-N5]NOK81059.1 response regulator transcription factor [Chloroflexi bacterium AL-W]NOK89332.1 response regulator transcription factor [Chloroflexi bacterium AL-N15]